MREPPGVAWGSVGRPKEMRQAVTEDEIREAIVSLTEVDLVRLERFAFWRIQMIGGTTYGHDAKDLLYEAIVRTLDGRRTWNRVAVDFKGHLIGVIRSVCSEWKEKSKTEKHKELLFESDLVGILDCNTTDPLRSLTPPPRRPEDILEAQDSVAAVRKFFQDDKLVLEIIDGLEEGMAGPDIRQVLGISQKELETAKRRLHRSISKIFS